MALEVERLSARVLVVPTDRPESDGTLAWERTTMVLVEARAGEHRGVGYTYGDAAVATLIDGTLAPVVTGGTHAGVPACWDAMAAAVRNDGRAGIAAMAISAVDVALWDLVGRMRGLPLADLLGRRRDAAPVYGSGGFCSYDDATLVDQLAGWAAAGLHAVKIKVGRDPDRDLERVTAARQAIGDGVALFVDANGAYDVRRARAWAMRFAEQADVRWLEEPVSSDDLSGLRRVRDTAPPGMAIAAGEYAYGTWDALRMLQAEAVDVQQADVTRCGGITRVLQVAALADAHGVPFSAHCAPTIHLHVGCAAPRFAHLEWFHDHVRIERMLFDGFVEPGPDGAVRPDPARPGLGVTPRPEVLARYAA